MEITNLMSSQSQPAHHDPVANQRVPSAPSVLVFDVNETLLDFESMAPLFQQVFGDHRILREWMGQLFLYSMTLTLSGLYIDFFTLGQGLLSMLADIHGVDVTGEDIQRIKDGMLTMPAHPDVEDGLTILRDNGFRLVTLTNSPPDPHGQSPLQRAGLGRFFEHQFSVDACRAFKPAQQVYHYVTQELDVPPSTCMMVAAHVWDDIGAQSAGFSSALITRPGNAPLRVHGLPRHTFVAPDLKVLAQQLITLHDTSASRQHP
jgi:2-haloacid dehalogenase